MTNNSKEQSNNSKNGFKRLTIHPSPETQSFTSMSAKTKKNQSWYHFLIFYYCGSYWSFWIPWVAFRYVRKNVKFHEFFVIFDYSLYCYTKFVGVIRIISKYSRSRSQEAKMVLKLLGTKWLNKQWSKQVYQGWKSTCLVSYTWIPKAIVGWEAKGIQGSLCMHSYWR